MSLVSFGNRLFVKVRNAPYIPLKQIQNGGIQIVHMHYKVLYLRITVGIRLKLNIYVVDLEKKKS